MMNYILYLVFRVSYFADGPAAALICLASRHKALKTKHDISADYINLAVTIYRLWTEGYQTASKSTETESHRHQAGFGETGLCPSDCHRLLLIA